jgi:hypothetical protein
MNFAPRMSRIKSTSFNSVLGRRVSGRVSGRVRTGGIPRGSVGGALLIRLHAEPPVEAPVEALVEAPVEALVGRVEELLLVLEVLLSVFLALLLVLEVMEVLGLLAEVIVVEVLIAAQGSGVDSRTRTVAAVEFVLTAAPLPLPLASVPSLPAAGTVAVSGGAPFNVMVGYSNTVYIKNQSRINLSIKKPFLIRVRVFKSQIFRIVPLSRWIFWGS